MSKNVTGEDYILLNKPFAGGWIDESGHIAHEIIDYFKADNEKLYFYNLPYGKVPGKKNKAKPSKDLPKYIVLVSRSIGGTVEIQYVLKPKAFVSKNGDGASKSSNEVKEKIENDNIGYGGKLLDEIYSKGDNSWLVTYEIKEVYQPTENTTLTFFKKGEKDTHSFHTSCIVTEKDEEHTDSSGQNTYQQLINLIEFNGKIDTNRWELYTVNKVSKGMNANLPDYTTKTFLDFVIKQQSEDCYTGMLFNIFEGDVSLFIKFLEYLRDNGKHKNQKFDSLKYEHFKIEREKALPKKDGDESTYKEGRMDICAESESYRVVIENKIDSHLNDVNKEFNTTQLTKYHKWAKEGKIPICFVLVPDRNVDKIKAEMNNNFGFDILQYYEIVEFFNKYNEEISKIIAGYGVNFDTVRLLFDRQAHTEHDTHESLFLKAINEA